MVIDARIVHATIPHRARTDNRRRLISGFASRVRTVSANTGEGEGAANVGALVLAGACEGVGVEVPAVLTVETTPLALGVDAVTETCTGSEADGANVPSTEPEKSAVIA